MQNARVIQGSPIAMSTRLLLVAAGAISALLANAQPVETNFLAHSNYYAAALLAPGPNDVCDKGRCPGDLGVRIHGGLQLAPTTDAQPDTRYIGPLNRNVDMARAQDSVLQLIGAVPSSGTQQLGAGVQYRLTMQWSVTADWDQYQLNATDRRDNVSLYSVGTRYRF